MDADRFDALSRALTTAGSRRTMLRGLLGTLLGRALLEASPDTLAERHRRNGKGRDTKSGRGKAGRDNDGGKNHRKPRKPSATDQQTLDRNEGVAAAGTRDAASDEVTATDHGCRHAGTGCSRGRQCCTGKCLRRGKCSCDASNPCPLPADACKQAVCSSTGRCVIEAAPCDDGNECTDNRCSGGVCSNPSRPVGAACSIGVCDGGGQCVECLSPTDCPGLDTGCASRACNSGTCGTSFAPVGTPCNESGGRVCEGLGTCVECLVPADCPSPTNPCQRVTCFGNTCVYPPAVAGTVCRPAVDACDVAETCDGVSTVCPADARAPDDTICTGDLRCCGGICCQETPGACVGGECPSSCFVAGTRVAMADGTSKPIELVESGDLVLSRGGGANRVVGVERPPLGGRRLYALNGGAFFVTAEHPFATPEGWKAVDPAATRAENPRLPVARLGVGDELLALAAVAVPVGAGGPVPGEAVAVRLESVPLRSVEGRVDDPATTLYNLLLDGDHTYFADELLVHNKVR